MRSLSRRSAALFLAALIPIACGEQKYHADRLTPQGRVEENKPRADFARDEVPPDQLDRVLEAHFQGLGRMEQYAYADAAERFRAVHERAPGWIAGSINLAIALLNQGGEQTEKSKGAPTAGRGMTVFEEALPLLDGVIARDPRNKHAHFCRGLILQQFPDRIADAHADFLLVSELDPSDAHAWFRAGMTLETSAAQAPERIRLFAQAVERNPYLAPALYNLAFAYRLGGHPEKQAELLARWNKLKSDQPPDVLAPGPADAAEAYGEMGRYATVINPFPTGVTPADPATPPRFETATPLKLTLGDGCRWSRDSDFSGKLAVLGRARRRFGAPVASFDADGDGKTDLYLAAAVAGPDGVRDALLLNKGEGRFEDATLDFGLPKDRASLGVAAGDFDADRRIDLFLTGVGDNRLFHNIEGKRFEDATGALKGAAPPALALTARWLDIDQDGDLDLYIINYARSKDAESAFLDQTPRGLPNTVYRNDGRPAPDPTTPLQAQAPLATAWPGTPARGGLSLALTVWPGAEFLQGGEAAHTGIALLDLDNDRDLDLVLSADGVPPRALINDRLGRFHESALNDLVADGPSSGLLATDLDKDGRTDLVALTPRGKVRAWRNTSDGTGPERFTFERWPLDARDWCTGQAADLDLDGWPDLLGLPAGDDVSAPAWARNEGKRSATHALAVGLAPPGLNGLALADIVGDPLPDLILLQPGEAPRVARNQGNGHHWMSLELGGHWRVKPQLMRTNSHAIGTRLLVEGQGVHLPYDHTTQDSGLAQSVGPVVLGLGKAPAATLIHARWPDGVLQCELNPKSDQKQTFAEDNRKTGSCPVLFTWNNSRFVCLGDFLGGGGIGYLVAPGVYGQPDRDEAVAISGDELRADQGVYRLVVTEPMDEVAYLDRLVLQVVDRPPGVSATPDERFAPEGPRPTGELIAWRETVEPVRATDLAGKDVTDRLRARDRETVDGFRTLPGWIGYAEEHGIVLDFGDRLSKFGPKEALVLCLAGWVEYPYSQTNYAAATAGVRLRPPTVERRREDGTWEVIEPHAGYPAGLPRMTTLDLTGKLTGPRCAIRLRTNMECYWDQAFLALRDRSASIHLTSLPVTRAVLGYRGYLRESAPDGRPPFLYDYQQTDPAPLARMEGRLTRYGEVARLLREDDDQLCLVGPGDEVRLEFDATQAPPLPPGWARSYVLQAVGYCKDADPFTGAGDTVGPLPWRGMPSGFPFGTRTERPLDQPYRDYLRLDQTRGSGAP